MKPLATESHCPSAVGRDKAIGRSRHSESRNVSLIPASPVSGSVPRVPAFAITNPQSAIFSSSFLPRRRSQ